MLPTAGHLWLPTLNKALGGRGWPPLPWRTESGQGGGPGAESRPPWAIYLGRSGMLTECLKEGAGVGHARDVGLVLRFLESWWVGEGGGHYVLQDCPRTTRRPVSTQPDLKDILNIFRTLKQHWLKQECCSPSRQAQTQQPFTPARSWVKAGPARSPPPALTLLRASLLNWSLH